MADSFLYNVVKDVLAKQNGEMKTCAVIFPNKRPEQYFIRELKSQGFVGNLPSFFSIEAFVEENAGTKSADTIDLLLILFKLYLKHYPESDFDAFYSWGTMMLGDFDEIDRYMADPAALFKNLSAVKDLEKYFLQEQSLPFEMLPDLMPEDEQYLKKRFLENWQVYEKIYYDLKKELVEKNMAYSGMNYRMVAEMANSDKLKTVADKFIFIGFNAISKSEEVIIQKLIDVGKALVYWDGDKYFIDNQRESSGHFIRKSMQRLRGYNPQLFGNQLLSGTKDIHIIGAPLKVGQAKTLGAVFNDHLRDHNPSGSTAIVLADENMRIPVLYTLPQESEPINITSGYPLKFSTINGLFQSIAGLIANYRPEAHSFYHKHVMALLSHPFIRMQNEPEVASLISKIQEGQMIYVPLWEIEKTGSEVLKLFFREIKSVAELDAYFRGIFAWIENNIDNEPDANHPFQVILENLSVLVSANENEISKKTYLRLFKEKVSQATTTASVQDLTAIQMMGMLETRCLDFETVFMLSVNEGVIPETKKNRSYIPFDIRKNFGLPTVDEQESLYAYNFYRLLQRAKYIYLIFDSETGSGGEEQSRYLRQIEYYLPKANPNINVHRSFYGLPIKNIPAKEIIVQKGKEYFEALKAKNETGFSPTLISAYFICQLQFYFKHILKIPERETIVEDLEPKHFGTLFHGLMEKLYEGLKGIEIDAKILSERKSTLTFAMDNVIAKVHKQQKENILQKNNILIETVKILAEKTMEADIAYSPFKMIDTEVEATYQMPYNRDGFGNINLKGIIDRIDEKNGVARIVDYKTGRVKLSYFNYKELGEKLYKDNKEAFQTLFYGLLYLRKNPAAQLKPSIMPLREVVNGYMDVNEKDGLYGQKDSEIFEEKLKSIIHSILDPEIPIAQTEDLNICQGCSYKNMCMR